MGLFIAREDKIPKGLGEQPSSALEASKEWVHLSQDAVLLSTLNQVMPQLADALPTVITAIGALLAAVSEPPQLMRRK